jgi:hypothetical protein
MSGQSCAQATSRTSLPESRRYCRRCSPGLFRRVNRASLLERTLLTWLGFYPWECVSCRRKRFFRDAGARQHSGTPVVI